MEESTRSIWISFIIGLIVNLISTYLFTLKKINLNMLLFVGIGSLIVIIIMSIQIKVNNLNEKLEKYEQRLNQNNRELKQINESLKIYERLSKIEAKLENGKK